MERDGGRGQGRCACPHRLLARREMMTREEIEADLKDVRLRWRLRTPETDTVFQMSSQFEHAWQQALEARGAGEEVAIDFCTGGDNWIELHTLMIPQGYIGKDDEASRVRR